MRLGIDAVGAAGGIVEAAVCYTGDITDTSRYLLYAITLSVYVHGGGVVEMTMCQNLRPRSSASRRISEPYPRLESVKQRKAWLAWKSLFVGAWNGDIQ